MEESANVMRAQKEAIKERFPEEVVLDLNLEGQVGVHNGYRHSTLEEKTKTNTTQLKQQWEVEKTEGRSTEGGRDPDSED